MAAQMRHSDPTTTLRVYTQVMKHSRHGVAQRLDDQLWGATGKEVANGSQTAGSAGAETPPAPSNIGALRP